MSLYQFFLTQRHKDTKTQRDHTKKGIVYLLCDFVSLCLCVKLSVIVLLLLCTGCNLGPNYYPPEICISEEWNAPMEVTEMPVSYEPPPTFWWEIFGDPLLDKYIQIAANYNNDVLKAEANIFQSRAMRQVAAAPFFPKIAADYNAFHIFLSKNGLVDAFSRADAPPPIMAPTPPSKLNIFNAFIDASWEIDLFGKTQKNVEAAQAQLESTLEQRNDILTSVFGELTRNYIELRSSQKQKILLEKNIALLKKNVDIIQKRYQTGYSNLLDLEQINIQLNQAISALPAVNITIYHSIYAISVLIGDFPESLMEELLPFQPLPPLPECLSTGLRSDLLRRRPDVRAAERNLAQATANIGVAVASFYPSFTLVGIFGLQSLKLQNLFTPNSKTWLYGADFNLPIFQGGTLVGNLNIAEAQTAALAFTYQQTVLNALRDAESNLISYGEDRKAVDELQKIVTLNQKITQLNKQRHINGLTNKLDYLNSELILNNSELSLLESETAALLDLVSLYKALGGGWEPFIVD